MTLGDVGQEAVWRAVAELASAWADLPVVRSFAAQLPRNARQQSHGLPGLLQHVTASGGMVAGRPLRLGTNVPVFLSALPGVAVPSVQPSVLDPWLDAASRVERAHRVTIAWLRSRLPGYPQLPAPQLARGTSLTTNEFTYRLQWTHTELAAGLQFRDLPPEPLEALGATAKTAPPAAEAARRLALAFTETAHWQRLREAGDALSPTDRAELVAARKAVATALKPTLVDAHDPDHALARDAYRQHVVAEVVEELTGTAREYAEAFDAMDLLIELAASDVFGQLAVYDVSVLKGVTQLAANGHGRGTVAFTVGDTVLLNPGTVAWLDDPLVQDAVHLTALTFDYDQAVGMRVRATGTVLTGTSTAWHRPAR